MTQLVLSALEDAAALFSHAEPKPLTAVDVLGGGRTALEQANQIWAWLWPRTKSTTW